MYNRAHEAHALRLGGCDWPAIATQVGYATGRVAAMAVNAYLQKAALEQAPEVRREALQLELARLDRLQSAYWSAAIGGDLNAAIMVLKIISCRARILGLDRSDPSRARPMTGTSVRYPSLRSSMPSTPFPGAAQG